MLVSLGCAARSPSAAAPRAAPIAELHRGPLTDFVAAAGLRWLLLARPKQVLASEGLADAVFAIAPRSRFDAFAHASGVDLRQVQRAMVAGFDYATLYLAELPADSAETVRRRFAERLLFGATVHRSHARLTRVTGVVGQTPETMLTIDDRLVALSVGDPTPVRVAEAFARGQLHKTPAALEGAALSQLPDLFGDHPLVLLAPGPFAGEWEQAAGGLFTRAVALGVGVRPLDRERLSATLVIAGAFSEPDAAARVLEGSWEALARSPTGALFELERTLASVHVAASASLVTLRVTLELAPLVKGLRAVVLEDITGLFGLHLEGRERGGPILKPEH